jgi:acyl-coenzyme A thioesterase PaaI-like protein
MPGQRRGSLEVELNASDKFVNPAGVVQGGFLPAMLEDRMGSALIAGLDPPQI